METLMVFCYTLEVGLVVWMQYKLICENMTNMLMLHQICIHFQGHLPIYGLIEIQLCGVFTKF
jgi:hypothetical protein